MGNQTFNQFLGTEGAARAQLKIKELNIFKVLFY
jgi:hypothetical protein